MAMLSLRAYAKKYSLNDSTVVRWLANGRLPGSRTRQSWLIPDEPPPPPMLVRASDRTRGGKIKCCTCRTYHDASRYTSATGRKRGRCGDCCQYLSRRAGGRMEIDDILHGRDIEIGVWLEAQPADIAAHREADLIAHAKRIKAMGLAGNGKD